MPSLPTDGYEQQFDYLGDDDRPRVIIRTPNPLPVMDQAAIGDGGSFSSGSKIGNRLFGTGGEERYQTWPEKMIREAVSAPGDVLASKVPMTSEDMIAPAQAVSALAGTGILGAEKGALGSAGGKLIQPTEKAPTFYSAVERQVADSGQAKASGDQWLSTLGNKPGVKPEELQWTGLDEFLKGKKSVTKEEIQQHLEGNKVELGEVTRNTRDTYLEQYKVVRQDGHVDSTYDNAEAASKRAESIKGSVKEQHETKPMDDTKYSQYQVPGGDPGSYREVLMTLPDKIKDKAVARGNEITARRDQIHDEFNAAAPDKRAALEDEFDTLGKELRELDLGKYAQGREASSYKSSHWDEPNILAHMRMNDRTIDGKKSLHLEEIQSDWHQDGRKKGYKTNEPEPPEGSPELMARRMRDASAVPDAPFKKNWHELALKRAIAEAVDKGYDKLSWTAGEHHPTNPKNLNQTGPEADAADRGMQGFYNNILPKSVEKLTGQKVQEGDASLIQHRIVEEKWPGGEGFDVHYGNKVLKTFDSKTDAQKFIDAQPKGRQFFHIDIPQSLREKIVGKGQPLFSAPPVLIPVDHNPFDDKNKFKLTPVQGNPFND